MTYGLRESGNTSQRSLSRNAALNREVSRRRISSSPSGTILGDANALPYPQLSRTAQSSSWSRGSSSRVGRSLSSSERIARPNEEPESNISQNNTQEIPIFAPTIESPRDLNQIRLHRTPRFSHRLLEERFRRSSEYRGQSSNLALEPGSSSQQVASSSGTGGDDLRLRSAL